MIQAALTLAFGKVSSNEPYRNCMRAGTISFKLACPQRYPEANMIGSNLLYPCWSLKPLRQNSLTVIGMFTVSRPLLKSQ